MNRTIIYYSFAVFIGCVSSLTLLNNAFLGAVIAASFLTIIFITIKKKKCFIILLFFFCGIISFVMYFNISMYNQAKVRIIEKNKYYCIGNYNGRKVILKGKTKNLEQGQKVCLKGQFKGDKMYDQGVIGIYTIKDFKPLKNDVIYKMYHIKKELYSKFLKYLDDEKTALIMSLCFGEKKLLSHNQKFDFQTLGVIHAIAVSGFHLSIIYKTVELIMGFKLAILVSFIYTIFTGMRASTLRAFIMIVILKMSNIVYKNYDGLSALSFAAMVMLIIKPYYVADMGFSLSFLATLGIILYYKKIRKILYKLPEKLNQSVSIALSAQVFTMPYIAFTISNFGMGFLIGNIFLVPIYSMIVIAGNLALVFINFNSVFQLISLILQNLCIAVEGATYLLLKISPGIKRFTFAEGIAMILFYISYLLVKHGHKKYKYMPLFIAGAVFMSSYEVFPKINFIGTSCINGLIVKYKTDTIMVCNYDVKNAYQVLCIKERMSVDKIITNPLGDVKLKLNDKLYINIYNKCKVTEKVEIIDNNKKLLFTSNNKLVENIKSNYDIINVKLKNNQCYKIIFGKPLNFKY